LKQLREGFFLSLRTCFGKIGSILLAVSLALVLPASPLSAETGGVQGARMETAAVVKPGTDAPDASTVAASGTVKPDPAAQTGSDSANDERAAQSGAAVNDGQPAVEPGAVPDLAKNARSAILMDADSGTVIYEKNGHEPLPPASITKVMTMLLVMEALDRGELRWNEPITVSEYAASMGGSQIFLEPGEQMTVEDLMKGVAMASANDASVALAERIAGSEELFVQKMNERARELGMKNTRFVNSNGLPAPDHYTSAHDIAIMSRELLKHEEITKYTGKYQDYLRSDTDNPFWLVNTNKLVRFYEGADGLKTGYTSEAKFCLSATAKKGDFRVIAVVLGEPDTKTRNSEVAAMFNYAFSQYTNLKLYDAGAKLGTAKVEKGKTDKIDLVASRKYSVLLKKGIDPKQIRHELVLKKELKAPVAAGQVIGTLNVYNGDQKIAEFPVESPVAVDKAGLWTLIKRTAGKMFFLD
jgi:D-alanyl-D-alanine carboxypeptidase (penicillin-binding protein 5/6)